MIPSPASIRDNEAILSYAESSYQHWRNLDECLKTFSIFDKEVRQSLDRYFILYWEPSFFLDNLVGPDRSIIIKDDTRYYVIYQELLSPEYITAYKQLRISFRKLPELSFGFALVRSLHQTS
jgi:hypothetical protein